MIAQFPVQDAFAHVNGIHFRRAVLQEAIGEATGGSAHIGADFACHIEVKGVKSGLQFLPPAGDEARTAVGGQFSSDIHFRGGLGDHLTIGAHLTGHHQTLSLRAALRQAALHQHHVNPFFLFRHAVIVSSGLVITIPPTGSSRTFVAFRSLREVLSHSRAS